MSTDPSALTTTPLPRPVSTVPPPGPSVVPPPGRSVVTVTSDGVIVRYAVVASGGTLRSASWACSIPRCTARSTSAAVGGAGAVDETHQSPAASETATASATIRIHRGRRRGRSGGAPAGSPTDVAPTGRMACTLRRNPRKSR